MLIVRGESRLAAEEVLRRARGRGIVLLNPGKVGSLEELELAYALAKKSIAGGKAVSEKMEVEFVLWLAGKRDIRRAFEEVGWNGKGKELIAVSFGMWRKELFAELELREKKLGLNEEAGWEAVERISLSRII